LFGEVSGSHIALMEFLSVAAPRLRLLPMMSGGIPLDPPAEMFGSGGAGSGG
jgi:hypothetical protein